MKHGRVAVLGGGSMGTTLAHVIASAGRPCLLWSDSESAVRSVNEHHRHERLFPDCSLAPSLRATRKLAEAVDGATLVICAVRSSSFPELARELSAMISREHVLLSATKGIDLASLTRMSEILAAACPDNTVGAIAGPNVTHEIMARRLSAIVVATSVPEAAAPIARHLETELLRVYTNDDLIGVEWIAILKNVIAIAVGIGNGLELAANTQSFLITRSIAEICHLVGLKGGRPATFWGLSGIGDLYLTTTSRHSLNRDLGIQLGKGRKLDEIVAGLAEVPEGINAVRGCAALAAAHGLDLPIANTVRAIMDGEVAPGAIESVIAGDASFDIDRHV